MSSCFLLTGEDPCVAAFQMQATAAPSCPAAVERHQATPEKLACSRSKACRIRDLCCPSANARNEYQGLPKQQTTAQATFLSRLLLCALLCSPQAAAADNHIMAQKHWAADSADLLCSACCRGIGKAHSGDGYKATPLPYAALRGQLQVPGPYQYQVQTGTNRCSAGTLRR